MPAANSKTTPLATFDTLKAEKLLAGLLAANNLTSDALWAGHVDGRTDPQLLIMVRNFFKAIITVKATPD